MGGCGWIGSRQVQFGRGDGNGVLQSIAGWPPARKLSAGIRDGTVAGSRDGTAACGSGEEYSSAPVRPQAPMSDASA